MRNPPAVHTPARDWLTLAACALLPLVLVVSIAVHFFGGF